VLDQNQFQVEPKSGVLEPYEIQVQNLALWVVVISIQNIVGCGIFDL